MTRPVTVTVRVPFEVTLICTVRVTPGHPGTRDDPPEPDEYEVTYGEIDGIGSDLLEVNPGRLSRLAEEFEGEIQEAASDAVARGEG